MDLRGKNVVVTGASQGIGEQIAEAFADAGCTVLAIARSKDRLAALSARIGGHAIAADLATAAGVDGLVDRCIAELGHIDVWVNNAGVETRRALKDPPARRRTARRVRRRSWAVRRADRRAGGAPR